MRAKHSFCSIVGNYDIHGQFIYVPEQLALARRGSAGVADVAPDRADGLTVIL